MNQQESTSGGVAESQSDIVRQNIAAITQVQHRESSALPLQERVAGWITDFSGSMVFVYLHSVWFGLWILLNIGLVHIPYLSQFDPYPFGLLTLVVSLEAIFLSTFVLIAQNRLARQSERRADLDLQINLLAEQKAAKVLEMLDQIAQQLDQTSRRFNYTTDAEVERLKVSPQPQEILQVIEEEATRAKQEVTEAAKKISDDTEAVREDMREIREKVDEVTSRAE